MLNHFDRSSSFVKMLAGFLADYTDRDDVPSQRAISDILAHEYREPISSTSISEALHHLQQIGAIKYNGRWGSRGFRFTMPHSIITKAKEYRVRW